jgi:septum formation protein
MPQTRLILASQSVQRRLLLEALGLEFTIEPADLDELQIQAPTPSERVRKIAREKARAIQAQYPDKIVVAADTYVVVGDLVLEKPIDLNEARQMLLAQSGREGTCYTGFCYLDGELEVCQTVETTIKFRRLSMEEVERYVNNNPVLTWSAAFSPAFPEGMALISEIQGSLTGFTHGMPAELLVPLLQQSGFDGVSA